MEALAGADDGAGLFVARGLPQSGGADLYWRPGIELRAAPVVRLDSLFGPEAVPVHLLKIDVEGYELAVLEGAAGLLADPERRPRALLVEVHSAVLAERLGRSAAEARALLERHGYRITELGDGAHERWIARV